MNKSRHVTHDAASEDRITLPAFLDGVICTIINNGGKTIFIDGQPLEPGESATFKNEIPSEYSYE